MVKLVFLLFIKVSTENIITVHMTLAKLLCIYVVHLLIFHRHSCCILYGLVCL